MTAADTGSTINWTNWARNQTAPGTTVVRPRSTEDVVDLVKAAQRDGRRLKAIGSGHSFTAIGRPEDLQVSFDQHADLVSLDRDSGLVTVEAGMPLHRLNRLLAEAGLAMTNLGDIEQQTIAGALSTGTHGTGHRFGGLATQVRALEIVLGDGSVASCSPDERPELFSAARVSLGALGLVTAVTLQTEPLYLLRAEEGSMPLLEVLDRFEELASGADHFEFYWFPHTQSCLTKSNTRLSLDVGAEPLPRWREWIDDEFLSNTVFGGLIGVGKAFPRAIRPINRFAAKALSARTFTDISYKVFTSPRRVRFIEMEYAVPRGVLVDVLREFQSAVEASGLDIAFPVEVRVAAADDVPLSTASGRESAYIAIHLPSGAHVEPYFRILEGIVGSVAGRPHWGKMHYLDAATLRERYPRFDEFIAVRDEVDPQGMFSNAYLDRVLGPVRKA